ncbi:uncharacterized protein LOC144938035 [Lampetra fluviatilis]
MSTIGNVALCRRANVKAPDGGQDTCARVCVCWINEWRFNNLLVLQMNTALEGAMVEEVEDCGVAATDEVQGSRENRAALRSGAGQGRSSKTLFQPQRFGRGVPPPAADCPESAASWAGLQDGNADRASRSEPFWHRTRPQRFGKRGGDSASPM